MHDINNFYTSTQIIELKNGVNGPVFGKAIIKYEIRKYIDVTSLGNKPGYILIMNQRVIIPNKNPQQAGPTSSTSYDDYPAIMINKVNLKTDKGATLQLRGMFPKTLNSSVSTSVSTNEGSSQSSSTQHTSGSSDTNVNTFGVAITGGFFGELPVGSLSLDYSHSWENSKYNSDTTGSALDYSKNTSDSESMSIKDWSSYGYLDGEAISPTWIWGQSYPWDVIQYNQSDDGTHINLPTFVKDRLLNGDLVLPPSQLSLFGLDFTMRAGWLIEFPDAITMDETVQIEHVTSVYNASHEANGTSVSATLQNSSSASTASYSSDALDLSLYALNPVSGAAKGGGVIGFTANEFTYPPTSSASNFKIVSPENNLQVSGKGFDSIMKTTFSDEVSLKVNFKITDSTEEYSLNLMHWIGETSGPCKLKCTINGKWDSVIYVDKSEGKGGQNNVSSLELRNTDFTSINFHDYLLVGNNEIVIDVVPDDSSKTNEYYLFAISVGLT